MIVVTYLLRQSITLYKNLGGLSKIWGLEPLSPIASAATAGRHIGFQFLAIIRPGNNVLHQILSRIENEVAEMRNGQTPLPLQLKSNMASERHWIITNCHNPASDLH